LEKNKVNKALFNKDGAFSQNINVINKCTPKGAYL